MPVARLPFGSFYLLRSAVYRLVATRTLVAHHARSYPPRCGWVTVDSRYGYGWLHADVHILPLRMRFCGLVPRWFTVYTVYLPFTFYWLHTFTLTVYGLLRTRTVYATRAVVGSPVTVVTHTVTFYGWLRYALHRGCTPRAHLPHRVTFTYTRVHRLLYVYAHYAPCWLVRVPGYLCGYGCRLVILVPHALYRFAFRSVGLYTLRITTAAATTRGWIRTLLHTAHARCMQVPALQRYAVYRLRARRIRFAHTARFAGFLRLHGSLCSRSLRFRFCGYSCPTHAVLVLRSGYGCVLQFCLYLVLYGSAIRLRARGCHTLPAVRTTCLVWLHHTHGSYYVPVLRYAYIPHGYLYRFLRMPPPPVLVYGSLCGLFALRGSVPLRLHTLVLHAVTPLRLRLRVTRTPRCRLRFPLRTFLPVAFTVVLRRSTVRLYAFSIRVGLRLFTAFCTHCIRHTYALVIYYDVPLPHYGLRFCTFTVGSVYGYRVAGCSSTTPRLPLPFTTYAVTCSCYHLQFTTRFPAHITATHTTGSPHYHWITMVIHLLRTHTGSFCSHYALFGSGHTHSGCCTFIWFVSVVAVYPARLTRTGLQLLRGSAFGCPADYVLPTFCTRPGFATRLRVTGCYTPLRAFYTACRLLCRIHWYPMPRFTTPVIATRT